MGHDERLELLSDLLKTAAAHGSSRSIGILIAYGADTNRESEFEMPLEAVPCKGNRETLDVLLAHGTWLEGRKLLVAHSYGNAQYLVGDLVRLGADVNSFLEGGELVLHHAASYCVPGAVESPISDGFADIDVRDNHNRTPLLVVRQDGCVLNRGCQYERKVLSLLLDAGADVHAIDCERRGVLHHAVQLEAVAWLPILLKRGADPNQRDIKGQTPMVWLLTRDWERMRYPAKPVLSILLEAGADPFLEDHAGNSAQQLLAKSVFGRAFMREKQAFFRRA